MTHQQVGDFQGLTAPDASPGVDVRRLDGVEEQLGHAHSLHVDEVRLEQSLGGFEALAADLNDASVRELWTPTLTLEHLKDFSQESQVNPDSPRTTPPTPSSPAPVSAPARCCNPRSRASPSSSAPSQSRPSG